MTIHDGQWKKRSKMETSSGPLATVMERYLSFISQLKSRNTYEKALFIQIIAKSFSHSTHSIKRSHSIYLRKAGPIQHSRKSRGHLTH